MTREDTGQRAAWSWSSYSLGEAADAIWRVADALGSSVEPVSVTVEPPRTGVELTSVELVVREPVDVRHLAARVDADEKELKWAKGHPDLWTAELNSTILTVRVDRES